MQFNKYTQCNLINTHTHTRTHTHTQCWAFRRTHTSTDPIRPICIRLAFPLALSLSLGLEPSARFMVYVSRRALWLVGNFACDCMFWDERGGGHTGRPVSPQMDTATITTELSTNRVDSRDFSTRCWVFRRTHTTENPIRLLCIRLALSLTLSLPSGFVPNARLMVQVGVSPRTLWLMANFRLIECLGTRGGGDLHRWPQRWTQQPLEQH